MSSRAVLPRLRSSLGSMAAVVGIVAFLVLALFGGVPDLGGAGRAVVTADSDPSAAVSALKRRDDSIYGDSNLHDLLDGVEPNDVGSTPPPMGTRAPSMRAGTQRVMSPQTMASSTTPGTRTSATAMPARPIGMRRGSRSLPTAPRS